MKLVYFSQSWPFSGDPYLEGITKTFPRQPVTRCSNIAELKDCISSKERQRTVVVLAAFDEATLIDIYFARYWFQGMPMVLILPDREDHTRAMASRIGCCHFFVDSGVGPVTRELRMLLDDGQGHPPTDSSLAIVRMSQFWLGTLHAEESVANLS